MAEIRLCLLGAGRWGKRYIGTIAALDGVRLTALASRNPDSAGLVAPDTPIFTDWRQAVALAEIDAVIVATPPALHAEMALAAIAAGKPVLVEKPLALTLREAEKIEQQSVQSSVLVMVGHTHLFNPAFRELKRQIPTIGTVTAIRTLAGNWGPFRPDVTSLWDWAPHDLAMCIDLVGRPPETVSMDCSQEQRDGGHGGTYRITLRFDCGVEAQVQVGNMLQPKSRWMEVCGDLGSLTVDDIQGILTATRQGIRSEIPFSPEKPLSVLIREFADAVRKKQQSDASLRLGADIVKILTDLSP